ncbi:MAG: efflux RND transporter periplasmic adaptor subunit [Pseudomonadota bacterium]
MMPTENNPAGTQDKPRLVSRILKRATAMLVTGTLVVGAGALVWQGSGLIAERAAAVEPPPATQPIAVATAPIDFRDHYTVERAFSGQIEALQLANMSFEQGGTVELVNVEEGDAVNKGQVLARLDDRLLIAERDRLEASKDAIEAQRELLSLNNERAAELNQRGFASNQTLDQTRLGLVELDSRLAEMDAALASIDVQLEKLTITAPFAGTINTRHVDPGTTVGGGQAILSLVEDAAPVFRVGIDPDLAVSLNEGQAVSVSFGDREFDAQIVGVLPQLDPVTRTQTVRARLAEGASLSFGQTGQMLITEQIDQEGAWIPLTAIEDGVRGLWTIKTVQRGETPTVGIEAVELIHVDERNAYVRGTFTPEAELIIDGLHRVVAGQTIRTNQ